MTSRMYEKMRNDQLKEAMAKAGVTDYVSICLSTDQLTYEVTLKDGSTITVPSGLPEHID
jgi:hypothetical protein